VLLTARKVRSKRGDAGAAFAGAAVQVDETYVTPVETHNPMEMPRNDRSLGEREFTLYESSQGVVNHLNVMAQTLGVPRKHSDHLQVCRLGLRGKRFHGHTPRCRGGGPQLNRPVKLTLSRKMMFSNVGHRPRTQQRMSGRDSGRQARLTPAGLSEHHLADRRYRPKTA